MEQNNDMDLLDFPNLEILNRHEPADTIRPQIGIYVISLQTHIEPPIEAPIKSPRAWLMQESEFLDNT